MKEAQIGALLNGRGLLAAKPEKDRFTGNWVPKVGRVTSYALCREEFGRSRSEKEPSDSANCLQGHQILMSAQVTDILSVLDAAIDDLAASIEAGDSPFRL